MTLRRRLSWVLTTALVLSSLTACTTPAPSGTWVATQASPTALVPGPRVSLEFTNGGLIGDDGCNPIGVTKASISGGRLTVSSVGTGLSACDEDLGRQEVWIVELLQSSPRITIDGSVMVLEGSGQKLRLEQA